MLQTHGKATINFTACCLILQLTALPSLSGEGEVPPPPGPAAPAAAPKAAAADTAAAAAAAACGGGWSERPQCAAMVRQ